MRISPKVLEKFGIKTLKHKVVIRNNPRPRMFYESPEVKYNWVNGDCVGYSLHPRLYAGRPPKPHQQSHSASRVSVRQNRSRRANLARQHKFSPVPDVSFNVDEWADRLLSAFDNTPSTKIEIFSEEELEFHRRLRRELEYHDGILGRMKFAQQYPEFRIGDTNPFGGPDVKVACCVFGGARKLCFPVPLRLMIDTMAEHGDHYKVPHVKWPRVPRVFVITCRPIREKGRRGLRLREKRFNTIKACLTGSNTLTYKDFALVYACKFLLGGSAFRVSQHKLPTDMYGQYMSLWDKLSLPVPP